MCGLASEGCVVIARVYEIHADENDSVVTPCHYDGYHNFFVQVYGQKTFLLAPPSSWQQLQPFPFLHPSHGQCQRTLLSQHDAHVHDTPASFVVVCAPLCLQGATTALHSLCITPGAPESRRHAVFTSPLVPRSHGDYHEVGVERSCVLCVKPHRVRVM